MTILHTPSAAIPPRSGQPGTGIAPPRSCQAVFVRVAQVEAGSHPSVPVSNPAPATNFPTPQAHPSQASAGNSASSGSSAPPFLIHDEDSDIDPAFFAAWRETQYGPNDMEPA